MGILEDYRATEKQLVELESKLAKLRDDVQLKHELDFVNRFNALRGDFDYSLNKALQLIKPETIQVEPKAKRAERRVSTYINPHTDERLETRSGNNLVLRAWKQQYGNAVVARWKK